MSKVLPCTFILVFIFVLGPKQNLSQWVGVKILALKNCFNNEGNKSKDKTTSGMCLSHPCCSLGKDLLTVDEVSEQACVLGDVMRYFSFTKVHEKRGCPCEQRVMYPDLA